ncbi:MAG: carbonic anhydrase [Hyphomicrobiales bacterium]|nr:carbonic anhydrase [Hyphomicrobiales bacterium]
MTLPETLLEGYARFRNNRLAAERERFESLAEAGQRPKVMVVGCCDSRAAPSTIFDAGPGEIFVVRNVANMVPPYAPDGDYHGTSAALEFAVMALRVAHIVVLGHGRCGGIAAALADAGPPLTPGDFIGRWISLVQPALEALDPALTGAERQLALEQANVRGALANLRTFPCVTELETRGKLALHGAHFDIANGDLMVLDPETGAFSST